ncbi:MAG: HAD family hydrolase [Burkholderiales bacterium]|nr:HAD family hydrolase [Burkholderiales bacterium]
MTAPGRHSAAGRARSAVLFDFEGTLVDFQWQLGPAEAELRRAFARLGFDDGEFARGNYASMWNTAADLLAPQGRLAELRHALSPVYDRWDFDALGRWAPKPGAAGLLRGLVAGGLRAGVVSNIGRRALGEALGRFGYSRWLAPVVSRDEVTWMKPRAEGILRVLSEWRVAPDEALFVGDSRADVLGARAAGVPVAIIRGGECEKTGLADAPPDYMVSRLDELAALLGVRMARNGMSQEAHDAAFRPD